MELLVCWSWCCCLGCLPRSCCGCSQWVSSFKSSQALTSCLVPRFEHHSSLAYCHWLNLEISVPSLLGMNPFSSNSLNSLVSRSTGRLPSGISQICLNLWDSTVLLHAGNSGKAQFRCMLVTLGKSREKERAEKTRARKNRLEPDSKKVGSLCGASKCRANSAVCILFLPMLFSSAICSYFYILYHLYLMSHLRTFSETWQNINKWINKEGNLQLHWVISILKTGVMWVKVEAKNTFWQTRLWPELEIGRLQIKLPNDASTLTRSANDWVFWQNLSKPNQIKQKPGIRRQASGHWLPASGTKSAGGGEPWD